MFDKSYLKDILKKYKQEFVSIHWENEKYKWEAVKYFQDNWNIEASDFADMLTRSLSKTYNLLDSINYFPARMITGFAKIAPEEVRSMFLALFKESDDLYYRMAAFQKQSSILLKKYGNSTSQHYQQENAISIYLWLRYPDKYYIYKFKEVKAVSDYLKSSYSFQKDAYADNIQNFYAFYNEICTELKQDTELVHLLQSQLTNTCYPDPELKTLTFDIGFYINHYYLQTSNSELIMNLVPKQDIHAASSYTKEDFLKEVYMSEQQYKKLAALLHNKKNIILQGAPGVGKTFTAKRLAYSIMKEKDESRIEFVQFHQNYSYEDFIMGYKPVEDRFELKYGIFYQFCEKAANQPDKDYFFIIDEINRGNMSKIFGELLMLIERDYRDTQITLAYNGLLFSVPKNLYIIGMMNTADRSLAMIDYALRRRFSFFEIEPGFDSEGFMKYQNQLNHTAFHKLIDKIKDLNQEITLDSSLGKGFCIGHSYFCGCDVCTDEWLLSIVDYDILPMLSEYWFDDTAKIQRWETILHGVFQ